MKILPAGISSKCVKVSVYSLAISMKLFPAAATTLQCYQKSKTKQKIT